MAQTTMHESGVRAPVVIPRRRAAIQAPPPAFDVALAPAPVTWRSASASGPDSWHIDATAVGKEVGRLKPLDVIMHFASNDSLATYCNDTNVTCTKQWAGVVNTAQIQLQANASKSNFKAKSPRANAGERPPAQRQRELQQQDRPGGAHAGEAHAARPRGPQHALLVGHGLEAETHLPLQQVSSIPFGPGRFWIFKIQSKSM